MTEIGEPMTEITESYEKTKESTTPERPMEENEGVEAPHIHSRSEKYHHA